MNMNKLLATVAALMLFGAPIAHADPTSTAIGGVIAEEAAKCANGVGVPGGCLGPNGEVIKALRNGWNDITKGPGDHNELFGKHGFVGRLFRR
jgi:hypothetical protein